MNKEDKFKHLISFLHGQGCILVTVDLFDTVMEGGIVAGSEDGELTFTAVFGDAVVALDFLAKDIYAIKIFKQTIELTLLRLNCKTKDEEEEETDDHPGN